MDLTIEERTLIETYRTLDQAGKKELLRFAGLKHKGEPAPTVEKTVGQCQLKGKEEKPETASDPFFTE